MSLLSDALDALIESAKLLGGTEAKKGFGCYTQEDSRFRTSMYESINKHRRAIEAAVLDARPTDQRLLNLLCRIHRDGGHYIAEHGLDKAVEDADIRVAEQNAALDAQGKQEPVASVYAAGIPECKFEYGAALRKLVPASGKPIPLYAAPVVQPGMVMVPREPTKAMCIAAVNAIGWPSRIDHVQAKTYYTAMIAAAEGKE